MERTLIYEGEDMHKVEKIQLMTGEGRSVCAQVEGSGFPTPETALTEYLDAFRENDLTGMMNCFAVETFVEFFDFQEYWDGIVSISYQMNKNQLPPTNEINRQLNLELRRSMVFEYILRSYLYLTGASSNPKSIPENVSADEFFMDVYTMEPGALLSTLEYDEGFLYCDDFIDENSDFYGERNTAARNARARAYGIDEYKLIGKKVRIPFFEDMGAEFNLGYVVETARYGDLWYILNLGGSFYYEGEPLRTACGWAMMYDE